MGNLRITSTVMLKFCSECTIENGWFEYNLRLNRRQSSSDKKLFFLFRCPSSTDTHTNFVFHSNFRDVFHFFTRKTLREKLLSLNVCEAAR